MCNCVGGLGGGDLSSKSMCKTSLPNVLDCRFLSQVIMAGLFYGRAVRVCDGAGTRWALAKYTPPLLVTRLFHIHTAPHISALPWYYPIFFFWVTHSISTGAPHCIFRRQFTGSGVGPRLTLNTCRPCHTERNLNNLLARRHSLCTVSALYFIPQWK